MSSQQRVLVIDDEEGMRELLEIVLGGDGYAVTSAESPEEGRSAMEKDTFDIVVTDLRMGNDRDAGMEFLSWLRENSSGTPSIMMTAHGSVETAIEAMKRGASDYIMKPFTNDEIRLHVKRAIEQRAMVRENTALRKAQARLGEMGNMVGKSSAIEQVRDMIRRVAVLPSTIAIHGESGTGKELVARSIHQMSERAEKPFVAINCGGIPENLLESELFGHLKGAFTGATEDKEGLFATADGGTLFLDEIGEMPLSLQVKLLRVLDDHTITPLGATVSTRVDVRLVSATNRNLETMAKEGTFREDLYYRLNVIPIHVPTLHERADDIPMLARHFCKTMGEKLGRPALHIEDDALNAMSEYGWPGNVRELKNVMERAVALCDGDSITLSDLPKNVQNFVAAPEAHLRELPEGGIELEELIADTEKGLIHQALRRAKHSQKGAAKLLGLTARSLRYRLKKYGLMDE
ncbi:MAG: sigma-54-dependent Fis family transcriptional regulator [Candidatus Hydrogenedentes bacterium]|nr:sigma-54-dependent Fis family transcriptional regulator [Candidatus Hydrogenedentota bacterium]